MTTETTPTPVPASSADGARTGAKVLVLDRTGELATDIARIAGSIEPQPKILRLRRPTRVAEVMERNDVDVVVAGPGEGTRTGLRRLAGVHREHPSVVIVLAQNGTALPQREALLTGASEVLPYPARGRRARNAIQRAVEQAAALRREVIDRAPVPVADSEVGPRGVEDDHTASARTDASPATAQDWRPPTAPGHVFAITSATGGCGKTFFATNFAGYLAKATGKRVLLLDLDLQFGEVSVALRIRPEQTIAELVDEPGEVAEHLTEALVEHEAGYHVLCAPKDPVSADRVGPREATAVIEAARRVFDYVVVDTPPALNEVVLAAFDQSQSLIVMATMDIPSLKNMGVFLQTLDRLKIPAEGVSLVLNKAESGTGIELDHVLKLYPQGFSAVLPYAREVSRSINLGMPVVFSDPDAAVSRRLVEGAKQLVAPSEGADLPWDRGAPRRRGLFRRLLARIRRQERDR